MKDNDLVLTDEQRNVLGDAISALLPDGKCFVLLVAGTGGPTRLEVVSDLLGHADVIEGLCRWAADIVTHKEGEHTIEMLAERGAKLVQ